MAKANGGAGRGAGPAPAGPPVLRDPLFRVLLFSFIFSQLPVNMLNFVLLTRLFEMTGTSLATTFLWLANALPAVVLGPLAGAVVDVRDRKHVLLVVNLVRSAMVLALAVSGLRSITLIYALVFACSALNQFYGPAEFACLPSLLPVEGFSKATSTLFIAQQSTVLIGFSMGGVLVPLLGASGTLGLCAAMVFAAFLLVLLLPSMKNALECPDTSSRNSPALWTRMAEGFVFLARQRDVLRPFLLLLSGQGILSVIIVNVPAISSEILDIPVHSAGLAVVAPFAAGALAGAIQIPRFLARGARRRRVVEASLILVGICMALLIAAVPPIGGWPRIAAGAALSSCFGLAIVGLMVPSRTIVQERTPGGLQGRIFGNLSVLGNIVSVVPVVFSGTIAHLMGVRVPLGILGLATLGGLALSRRTGRPLAYGAALMAVRPARGEIDETEVPDRSTP